MSKQRFSYQREQIYQAVSMTDQHPTAETVYHQLKCSMPRLSLGTVYRNLHRMAQDGRLMEIDGPVARFDANTIPHSHLRCRFCGRVADLQALPYDPELDRLAMQADWQVDGHSLIFYGICPDCMGEHN